MNSDPHRHLPENVEPQKLHETMLAAAAPFLSAAEREEVPVALPSGNSAIVLRRGGIIVKAHRSKIDASDLNARLRLITQPQFRELFVQPLRDKSERWDARLLTFWPAGTPAVAAAPAEIDWEGSARLLAALHRTPFAGRKVVPPAAGWLARLARLRSRLTATGERPEKNTVLAAFATLPPFTAKVWYAQRPSVVHGDWHPGQVVHFQGLPCLIDVDDVGLGNPAWDLARPAAWRLAGFLADSVWNRFLNAYQGAGGPAVEGRDAWATLELPARAAVIQEAAKALAHAERDNRPLEDFELDLVYSCGRIARFFNQRNHYAATSNAVP